MTAAKPQAFGSVFGTAPRQATDELAGRILDAALSEWQEFGLRRTTVENVIRRARVGRMTFYRRFGGKEDLFRAVLLRELESVIAVAAASMASAGTMEDGFVEFAAVGLEAVRDHPLWRRLLSTDSEAVLPYLTLDAGEVLTAVVRFVIALIGDQLPPEDAALAAEAMTRIMHSMVLTPITTDDSELRSLARFVVRGLLRGAPDR